MASIEKSQHPGYPRSDANKILNQVGGYSEHKPSFTMEDPRPEDAQIISQAREKAAPMVDGTTSSEVDNTTTSKGPQEAKE